MNDKDPRYRGKDFLVGFIPSLIVAVLTIIPLFVAEAFMPLLLAGGLLLVATLVAFICLRPFIALGILTVLIAAPLLLMGSCFAMLAFE